MLTIVLNRYENHFVRQRASLSEDLILHVGVNEVRNIERFNQLQIVGLVRLIYV